MEIKLYLFKWTSAEDLETWELLKAISSKLGS